MKIKGYNVIIEDYDIWKDKICNLDMRARFLAEDMIALYQQRKDVAIVGADIVDNEEWIIQIFPDEKCIICKFKKL